MSLTRRVWELEQSSSAAEGGSEESVAAPVPRQEPAPVLAPLSPARSSAEWEAIVGTSWLNRIGVLMLVVGIALFLGYSLTRFGAAGKITIGITIGVSMLVSGAALRQSEKYRNFGLSLVGGGWAAVYFTTYAMFGLDAARVIHDPVTAALLLLTVCAGMVLHALTNRSEPATALAFLIGFVSLNVTPLTPFSVVATLVLAFSLIFLSFGFAWPRLAAAGVALTYISFAIRYDPTVMGRSGVWNGQVTLWTYWLLFETFDLLQIRRAGSLERAGRMIFLLNAVGFVGSSILHESSMKSADWALLFGVASLAYAASSGIRAQLLAGSPAGEEWRSIVLGGYEGAATASAGLMAAALVEKYSGVGIATALLVEGELLILLSRVPGRAFLSKIAAGVLVLPVIHLLAVDLQPAREQVWFGMPLRKGTPVAVSGAVLFLLHRWIGHLDAWYPYAAALLATAVLSAELSRQWLTVGLGVEAIVLLGAGLIARDAPTRWAGLFVFVACIGKLFLHDLRELDTLSRILSFVVLGLLLLGASWVYTRFRTHIRKLL